MARLHVDQVYLNDTKKDGTKYINKFGKEYKMCKVVSDGRYFTVWGTEQQKADIQVGQFIEGEITESEYNGTPQYTFNFPKPKTQEFTELDNKIVQLEKRVLAVEKFVYEGTAPESEKEECPLDQIPF
jgi:hypothetical protein